MSDPFTIEAPAPGAVFTEAIIAPENVEIVEGDERARKLSKKDMKRLRRLLRDAQRTLDAYDYDNQVQRLDHLRNRFQELKEQHHNSKQADEQQSLIRQAKRCKKAAQRIKAAIAPAKPAAARRNRLQQRLTEHEIAVANARLYKKLRREMQREVSYFRRQVTLRWSALGYREVIHKGNKTTIRRVKIQQVYFTEDEIHYQIKGSEITLLGSIYQHMPDIVRVADLVKPETLDELTFICERPVTSPHSPPEFGGENKDFSNGGWITVHRIGMNGGLFNYIELHAVLKKYNQAKRHKFPVPFGVRRGRKINYCYLDEHPHIFVDGQTFAGKTNAIVQGLCTLIQMHSPDEIRVVLVDLKQGGDLNPFRGIPHLITFDEGDVIKSVDTLEGVMARLVQLMYTRMRLISQITVDISKYNAKVDPENQLPRILVVIDEYSATRMNKGAKSRIDQFAVILSTQARAAGIHLMLGNQQPYADIVPREVRGNITFKLAGRQMTQGASMSAIGTGRATRIDKIPGRMICNNGHEEFDVQIPLATEQDIFFAVKRANDYPAPRQDVWLLDDTQEVLPIQVFGEQMVISLALREFDGALKAIRLWQHINDPNVSRTNVETTVKAIAAKGQIEHEGTVYDIVKRKGNFFALVPKLPSLTGVPVGETSQESTLETSVQEEAAAV